MLPAAPAGVPAGHPRISPLLARYFSARAVDIFQTPCYTVFKQKGGEQYYEMVHNPKNRNDTVRRTCYVCFLKCGKVPVNFAFLTFGNAFCHF